LFEYGWNWDKEKSKKIIPNLYFFFFSIFFSFSSFLLDYFPSKDTFISFLAHPPSVENEK